MNIRGPATYLVRVDCDSMQDAGMFSGDRLVVIGVVKGEHVCKRLDFVGGMPVLRSENAGYADRYVLESDDFSIWGVITHNIRSHN